MKLKTQLIASVELWLCLALLAALLSWESAPVHAQTVTNTTSVPVLGTVFGQPEVVTFLGKAQVETKLVKDPDFGTAPTVMITIDLSTVGGVGVFSRKKYLISGPQIFVRPLASSDFVDFTFSFLQGDNVSKVRTGNATFALSFNTASASIRRAVVVLSTPDDLH